jgi:putative DNA primase/helicase
MLGLVSQTYGVIALLSEFDTDKYLLNCQNGTYNLKTKQLQPHNPLDLCTKITGCDYDPTATSPHWDAFMLKIMCDRETLRSVQQIAGEGLVGDQQDSLFPICYGPGSNGKSTFKETSLEVLGGYADTVPSDLFIAKQNEGISNDKAALVGTRFLLASETDEGKRLNEALVKNTTGHETIKARFLRQEFFSFMPVFTPMLFTNPKPIIQGTDRGIWRRVKLIPWLHNFETDPERKDPEVVATEMRGELSGILNWFITGYNDRQDYGKLYISPRIMHETESYRVQSDNLGEFLLDYCITTERDAEIKKDDLYKKYVEVMQEAGQDKVTTKKGLGMKLQERTDIPYLGEKREGQMRIRYWTGIRLRTEYDPEPANPTPTPIRVESPTVEESPVQQVETPIVQQVIPEPDVMITSEVTHMEPYTPAIIAEETETKSQQYDLAQQLFMALEKHGHELVFLPDGKRDFAPLNGHRLDRVTRQDLIQQVKQIDPPLLKQFWDECYPVPVSSEPTEAGEVLEPDEEWEVII